MPMLFWMHFLLALVVFTMLRVEFLLWNWSQLRNIEGLSVFWAFFNGLRFDLSSVALSLSLLFFIFILLAGLRARKGLWVLASIIFFLIPQTFFICLNTIDLEFVNYVGRRLTSESLFIIGEGQGKLQGFLAAFWPLFLIAAMNLLILFYGTYMLFKKVQDPGGEPWNKRLVLKKSVFGLVSFLLLTIMARGGLQKKPVTFVDTQKFATPVLNLLVQNTTFSLLKSLNKPSVQKQNFLSQSEMTAYLRGPKGPSVFLPHPRAQNVVLIVLESFGLEYTSYALGKKSWTPFLDQLAQKSLFLPAYANGRRSIEGIAALISGLPALMSEPFISSTFATNSNVSLARLLSEHGYKTAFFHGGNNGTMYFDSYAQSVGFEHYFGAKEYPNQNDHDGSWGIYDGPFLRWTSEKISSTKEPFFVTIFTLSSHQPYLLPPEEAALYPDGPHPILKAINYTDRQLQIFFEEAAKQSWFEHTLFVITADHAFQAIDPAWENEISRYRIPILFYHPKISLKTYEVNSPVQQIDIYPSIVDFLSLDLYGENLLASSVFQSQQGKVAVVLTDNGYLGISDQNFVRLKQNGQVSLFKIDDVFEKQPLESVEKNKALVLKTKAHVQYFNQSIIDNKFYLPPSAK